MATQLPDKTRKWFSRRELIAGTVVLIALLVAAVWILSSIRLIPSSLATISSIVVTVAGASFTCIQLLLPSHLHQSTHPPTPITAHFLSSEDTQPPEAPSSTVVTQDSTAWNIPFRRNPFFTGREQLLTLLHDKLMKSRAAALTQAQAITGLGGIGKTQLALEYAYRYRSVYRFVFWVRAATHETLIADFVAVAHLLHLAEEEVQDQEILVDVVKQWLTEHTDWLLILDNADDLAILAEFLPLEYKGRLLLTSRTQALGSLAQSVEVEKMATKEGALLLLRRAKVLAADASIDQASVEERGLASEIVKALDGLPLALDQAGAYIEETQCGLSGYQSIYREQRIEVLRERGGLPLDHPDSVLTTFSLAFEQVQQASPIAADVLKLCAFLAPDAIPEEVFNRADFKRDARSLESNTHEFNAAIKVLLKYSLVRRNAETRTLTIHRLVQAVLKDRMDGETQQQWAERAVRAVNRSLPDVEEATWSDFQRFLPQALECTMAIEQGKMTFSEAIQLLSRTGVYLEARAQYAEAEELLQRACVMSEQALGPEHPETIGSAHYLAFFYTQRGKYEKAEELYRRVLPFRERVMGADHPATADTLNDFGILYLRQGKYKQAEAYLQRALAIRERVLGPEHPKTAGTLNNLGILSKNRGRYGQAEAYLQRALAIRERVLGPEQSRVADNLYNLGILYSKQGKYEQAEPLYQRAMAIYEKLLGSDHPSVANVLDDLGCIYLEQSKFAQAEPLLERALAIFEQALGFDHPTTAYPLNDLGDLYSKQGRYEQAEEFYQRALSIREQVLGPEHPSTAETLNSLARHYTRQGRYEQAEPLYQRALSTYEQVLGPEHPNVAFVLNNYADLLQKMNNQLKASELRQRALVTPSREGTGNNGAGNRGE